ncbi:hypothetical protein BD410DRAFT_780680 [Rickenella mellea]|uniref:Uncharacterized protein n=1 Tax=Rickenella mellea TaxID=50990 RepID=A0A4R5XH68_9AGAM|nr:hypothetical protein BD410DRAFT_780680 [Rickenella mellea]
MSAPMNEARAQFYAQLNEVYHPDPRNYLIHDLTHPAPTTPDTITFPCVEGINGRIAPFHGSFLLEFLWLDGTRVMDFCGFEVWQIGRRITKVRPTPSWVKSGCNTQIYFLNESTSWEIRKLDGTVIKKITFPTHLVVQ